MKTNIDKISVDLDLLNENDPRLVVVAKNIGQSLLGRYQQYPKSAQTFASDESLVAIVKSEPLATPDLIEVTHARRAGHTFLISIESRHYDGDLAANVETFALIQVELGKLPPGAYEVMVIETKLYFLNLGTPEKATNPTAKSFQLSFDVH
jgi:hypothetical protein